MADVRVVFYVPIIDNDGRDLSQERTDLEWDLNDTFDGFPMFTNDGKKLIWGSNRHGANPENTNVFIADWVDKASSSD